MLYIIIYAEELILQSADFMRFCHFLAQDTRCNHFDGEKLKFRIPTEYCVNCSSKVVWQCISCYEQFCNDHMDSHCINTSHYVMIDTRDYLIK